MYKCQKSKHGNCNNKSALKCYYKYIVQFTCDLRLLPLERIESREAKSFESLPLFVGAKQFCAEIMAQFPSIKLLSLDSFMEKAICKDVVALFEAKVESLNFFLGGGYRVEHQGPRAMGDSVRPQIKFKTSHNSASKGFSCP